MRVKLLLRAALPAALALSAAALNSCASHGAQMPQSPLLKFFERPAGHIVFISPDGNVRVINQKGGGSVALTSDAGASAEGQVVYAAPAWAPDGRQVAFARMTMDAASQVTDAALFSAGRDGRKLTRLLSGPHLRPFYLYWSPDSKLVSLLSSSDAAGSLELGVAPAGMEGGYRALDTGSPFYWAWRADSRALVEHVNTGQPGADGERLSLLSLGAEIGRAPIRADPGVFQAPSFSSDGKSVAYASTSEAVSTVHLRAADGSADRTVATERGGIFLSFSRDGRHLAYLAALRLQPVPLGTLNVVDLGSSAVKKTLKEVPVVEFFWSPDGRSLAFIIPGSVEGVDPMFAQSESMAYVRLMGYEVSSGRTWTIARFPPSQGFFSVVPFFDQYQRSSTIWSPDSKSLAFTAVAADGTAGIFVSHADGNTQPRFLASGDYAFWSLK
jgi:TolB protein